MDATKTYIKIYDISPPEAEDFEFDFTSNDSDLFTELVPNLNLWGEIGWMELEEYEYNPHNNMMHLTLETKWDAPTRWLQQASCDTSYFENKLIIMTTIQKDETSVNGVAVMDGELLQNKQIWSMSSGEVEKYYNDDEPDYDLDELDNKIWDSIGSFTSVCEKFYRDGSEDENFDS
jgi:hypothetical protein